MNYTDFIDNLMTDYADQYELDTSMPLALYELVDGYRLRTEHLEDDFIIDENGYVYELCENNKPVSGALVWAATESYQLALGA